MMKSFSLLADPPIFCSKSGLLGIVTSACSISVYKGYCGRFSFAYSVSVLLSLLVNAAYLVFPVGDG